MQPQKMSKRKSHIIEADTLPSHHNADLWKKRSLIFTHSNSDLFTGLLTLTKNQALSESFEEEQCREKKIPANPFLMAKHKLIIKEQNRSSNKPTAPNERFPLQDLAVMNLKLSDDADLVTMKQLNESDRNRKVLPKCNTDRVRRQ